MKQKKRQDRIKMAATYACAFIIIAILGITFAFRFDTVAGVLSYVWDALLPVTVGFIIAYLLFPAVRFFEDRLFLGLKEKGKSSLARGLSVVLAFSSLFLFLALIVLLLVPQLFSNYMELASSVEEYIVFAEDFADGFIGSSSLFGDSSTLSEMLGGVSLKDFLAGMIVDSLLFADRFVSFVIAFAGSLIDVAVNAVFSLVCAFGLMFYREKILCVISRIADAFLKENQIAVAKSVVGAIDRAFGGFFSGRLLESALIGLLSLVVFYVTGMPYPPLLAVILAIFNLIPYFGSIFAGIIGGVIVFVTEPNMIIWFLVIDLVMEQIDANVLAPRVLGDSVGIHPLCIIVSITVMGSLLGVVGLIIGVPTAAVFIDAVRYFCEKREKTISARLEESADDVEIDAEKGGDEE